MGKSLLTSKEIHELNDVVGTQEIAAIAGITKSAVVARLNLETIRDKSRLRYQEFTSHERSTYIGKKEKWVQKCQEESLKHVDSQKTKRPYTTEELDYIRKYGKTSTTLEVAMALQRTYRSVESIARRNNISLRNE